MLENNQTPEGVDREKIFSQMLSELPWASFRACVQSNAQVAKRCTAGGFRMDPKNRKRLTKVVLKEARKEDFSETFCGTVFAHWYPLHEDLHEKLESYFHSDEYAAYRKENDLDEDTYVLTDEKFNEFLDPKHLEQWRILLCFSPLKFTDEQAKRILNESQGSEDLLEKLRDLESRVDTLQKERERATRETERLREDQKEARSEVQELRQERRKLTTEVSRLQNKFEASQTENRKFREQLEAKEAEATEKIKETSQSHATEARRLQKDVEAVREELRDWRTRYEEQKAQTRHLKEDVQGAEKRLREKEQEVQAHRDRIKELNGFANLILDNIDWPRAGAAMKLTPSLKRQFNSLIKKLNYEEDRALTIEGTLPEFWGRLQETEKQLIDTLAESNSREVMTGEVEDFWRSLTDAFSDVAIGLEARCVLLKMLQEIFYQTLEIEDLEEMAIPTGSRRKRKSR